jgi:hypothetical protein
MAVEEVCDDGYVDSPDLDQCQAEKPSGDTFGTLGGGVLRRVRCPNPPSFIATEREPGKDGLVGSMSLCSGCKAVFEKQMGVLFATFKEISPKWELHVRVEVRRKTSPEGSPFLEAAQENSWPIRNATLGNKFMDGIFASIHKNRKAMK